MDTSSWPLRSPRPLNLPGRQVWCFGGMHTFLFCLISSLKSWKTSSVGKKTLYSMPTASVLCAMNFDNRKLSHPQSIPLSRHYGLRGKLKKTRLPFFLPYQTLLQRERAWLKLSAGHQSRKITEKLCSFMTSWLPMRFNFFPSPES